MYLKKLEIHGFKSFAKKTLLEFEKGITSVVGPNGSGKSNIADSLRWVFGEQSMKLLRGKKSEDVIFAGSDQKARLGAAEVQIFFDNADHQIPLDYEEVVVARRVYRDGNSEYLINGSQVRLLDIQDLLARSGFGNTTYCVIGQGTIDQLILRGPSAIKEMVEEASGVKPYYLKRERALRKLDRTESNLEQVRALVAEIEPRLRSLRRQTRKLERRSDIEKDLQDALVQYFGQQFQSLDRQIEEVGSKQQIFDKQLQELNREIISLSSDIDVQEKTTQGSRTNFRKIQEDLGAIQEKKFSLQEQLAVVRGKVKVMASESPKAPTIIWHELKSKFKHAFDRLQNLFKNYTQAQAAEVEDLFSSISEMIETAERGGRTAAEQQEINKLRQEEKHLESEVEKFLTHIKSLEADLKKFISTEEETKQQLFVKERLLRNKQDTLVKTSEQKNTLAVEYAKFATRKEAYEQEAKTALGSGFREILAGYAGGGTMAGLQEKIQGLRKQLEMIGGVDDLVMQEAKETEDRYQYLTTQSEDLGKGVADLKTVIAELDEVIKKEFHDGFVKISEKFSEYFRMLFGGGKAVMSLIKDKPVSVSSISASEDQEHNEEEETEENLETDGASGKYRAEIVGIDIRATPPGKKLAGISALSGGERALTAIALLSAILATYPTPFVVLDEVDAALDEANSVRFGKILATLAHKTQFITITHNRETMRQSHTLYGVTMGDDSVSKVLSLKLEQAAVYSSKN